MLGRISCGLTLAVLLSGIFVGMGIVEAEDPAVAVVYFSGVGCHRCSRTDPFVLTELPLDYGGYLVVVHYEIYQHPENALIFNKYSVTYGCGSGIPVVIFGVDDYLSGDESILASLKGKVDEYLALGGNDLPLANGSTVAFEHLNIEDLPGSPEIWGDVEYSSLEAPTLLAIVAAAALDAINPCAFAILVILLSGLIANGGRKKALKGGLAFVVAVFTTYLIMGFGIFSISITSGIDYYFYKAVGVFALIVAVLNIVDYVLGESKGVLSSIPDSWKPRVQKLLDDATSVPGALFSGFAVSLFLLPCTSGSYVVALGLMTYETTRAYAMQLLMLYNLIFVLPMIGVVLAVYLGLATTAETAHWRHKRVGLLHLIIGAIMFYMGIWMLFFY